MLPHSQDVVLLVFEVFDFYHNITFLSTLMLLRNVGMFSEEDSNHF